jgi:hypothetical protein
MALGGRTTKNTGSNLLADQHAEPADMFEFA